MKNFVQDGNTVAVVAPTGGVTSGQLLVVGSIIGVAAFTAAQTEDVEVQRVGVFTLPKVTTDVVTQGAKLYWDSSASKLTVTPGTGAKPLVGLARAEAGNGATEVETILMPTGTTGPA
jgi:predicted RecA/RadA family phage recombinase